MVTVVVTFSRKMDRQKGDTKMNRIENKEEHTERSHTEDLKKEDKTERKKLKNADDLKKKDRAERKKPDDQKKKDKSESSSADVLTVVLKTKGRTGRNNTDDPKKKDKAERSCPTEKDMEERSNAAVLTVDLKKKFKAERNSTDDPKNKDRKEKSYTVLTIDLKKKYMTERKKTDDQKKKDRTEKCNIDVLTVDLKTKYRAERKNTDDPEKKNKTERINKDDAKKKDRTEKKNTDDIKKKDLPEKSNTDNAKKKDGSERSNTDHSMNKVRTEMRNTDEPKNEERAESGGTEEQEDEGSEWSSTFEEAPKEHMENFVLYDELGKGEHSVIYKGRRKGTIGFVAIHCIEKCKRPEVTNTVRMTHDISHPNVVQFQEWYETSNHLWLVVELCTGGSLADILAQDKHLPESSIHDFGVHLVTGLHYIHSLGIQFNDLRPSKILLDACGVLKYADFGMSKLEGENLEELFFKFAEAGEHWNLQSAEDMMKQISTTGSPLYMAPEVFQGGEPSIMSDLWALGCVFYEMFAGHPPFLAESYEAIKEKVINKEFSPPKVKAQKVPGSNRSRLSAQPSPEFLNLLESLLLKDPTRRLSWAGLVKHPFWKDSLQTLAKEFTMSQDTAGGLASPSTQSSVFEHNAGSALGRIKAVDLHRSIDKSITRLDCIDSSRPMSTFGEVLRPKTAPGHDTGGSSLFTLSARPHTAVHPDEKVMSPYRQPHSPLSTREVIGITQDNDSSDDVTGPDCHVLNLVFHESDFTMSQIIDNPKIQKVPPSPKFDPKVLTMPAHTVEKLNSMPDKEFMKHMCAVVEALGVGDKGPPSQKRLQLLQYAASLACTGACATALVVNNALAVMAQQLRDCQHPDVRIKLARVIGLAAHFTDSLEDSINVSEPLTLVTEVLRENVKNSKVKQGLLPAVGEMLCMVASQERRMGTQVENWSVPTMVYTIITRYCRDLEDPVLNHIAAKIIETLATIKSPHTEKFMTNEIGQALWGIYKHSTVDALRSTALSALCRVTWQNPSVFQNVLDVAGLTVVCQALSQGITRVQQAVVTMFGALVCSSSPVSRLSHDKDFLQKVIRLLDSPSIIIRGKAFVLIHQLVCRSTEMLQVACQNRLVMYMERDSRQSTPRGARTPSQEHVAMEYLGNCLHLLVTGVVSQVPVVMREMLASLDAVAGRKHPSAPQVRQLKTTLPLLTIFTHLVTSQMFRNQMVTEDFMAQLGLLMTHVKSIESGETNIEAAADKLKVSLKVGEFVSAAMSVVEGISQHPALLMEHQGVVTDTILPHLVTMVGSPSVDTRARSLSLLSEIASVLLSQAQYESSSAPETDTLLKLITEHLLPLYESLLLDPEPLPGGALALMLSLLEHRPALSRNIFALGLVPVLFQIITDHHSKPLGRSMHSILGILNILLGQRNLPIRDLFDMGLVEHLTTVMQEAFNMCWKEAGASGPPSGAQESDQGVGMLQAALDLMNTLMTYVSNVVRKALQTKKGNAEQGQGKEAEEAEQLLLTNKPLTELTPMLTKLLYHEDTDVQDMAAKCLSVLVQLYGGESKDSLSATCLEYYSKALPTCSAKKQKMLLRVIKRLLTTSPYHVENLKNYGQGLMDTIHTLVHTASSHADKALTTLAGEILKIGGQLA